MANEEYIETRFDKDPFKEAERQLAEQENGKKGFDMGALPGIIEALGNAFRRNPPPQYDTVPGRNDAKKNEQSLFNDPYVKMALVGIGASAVGAVVLSALRK